MALRMAPKRQKVPWRRTPKPLVAYGLSSTPGETRTPNLLIRSQTLYPIELRAHVVSG